MLSKLLLFFGCEWYSFVLVLKSKVTILLCVFAELYVW